MYLKGTDQTKANSEVSVNITAIFLQMGKTVGKKRTKIADFCSFWKFQIIRWDISHNWYLSALLNLKLLIVIILITRKFCYNIMIIKFVCWTNGNSSLEIDCSGVATFYLSVTWFLSLWIKFRHVLHVKLRSLKCFAFWLLLPCGCRRTFRGVHIWLGKLCLQGHQAWWVCMVHYI